MVEKVATAAASKGSATVTAVKMSAMLFLLTRIGGFVFGAWWGLTALPVLRSMLQVAQL
ncbi:MAG: hypothetical protein JF571_10980, partial [Asticcacaulis sp.]|nr:hypothetical protein [Asticcacaulis sp.]